MEKIQLQKELAKLKIERLILMIGIDSVIEIIEEFRPIKPKKQASKADNKKLKEELKEELREEIEEEIKNELREEIIEEKNVIRDEIEYELLESGDYIKVSDSLVTIEIDSIFQKDLLNDFVSKNLFINHTEFNNNTTGLFSYNC